MTIYQKLTKIQQEFKSKKSRYNSFGKYYFRSAEDILEATKPFLKELDVAVTINEELISHDPPVLKVTAKIMNGEAEVGLDTHSYAQAIAIVGVDLDQKGMQMPQRYGAASSYGKKYALGNLFLIDDTQDADATNNHGKQTIQAAMGAAQLKSAKDYIKSGGKIDAIKAKYTLTKAQEKELATL
tara:strand:- start:813 stop:1364 length:552 start_codon:yes stop_codon:yes gene_type:complete